MMSVSEYANDVGKTIKEIIDLCSKLNINASKEDDILDDEMITR